MARLIQKGDIITLTNSGDSVIYAGSIQKVGSFIGCVINDIPPGADGSVSIAGVYEVPKGTATFKQGDRVYWNVANGYATATDTDIPMGYAWEANTSGSAGNLLVKLSSGGNYEEGSGSGS